jgi:hypothetical protein
MRNARCDEEQRRDDHPVGLDAGEEGSRNGRGEDGECLPGVRLRRHRARACARELE